MRKVLIGIMALVLVLSAVAVADVVTLKNGSKITGKIVEETKSSITLETDFGKLTFPRSDIVKIERDKKPEPQGSSSATGEAVRKGLEYLLSKQQEDGSWVGVHWRRHDIVETSLCGLTLMAGGSTLSKGDYQKHLKKCFDWVMKKVDSYPEEFENVPFSRALTWEVTYSAIFLTEIYMKEPSGEIAKRIKKLTGYILKFRRDSGGWCHSPAYPPSRSNYADDMTATTNTVITALYLIKKAKLATPSVDKILKDFDEEYYKKLQNEDGGMQYGVRGPEYRWPGALKSEPGRTAGAVYALTLLGKQDSEVFKKALAYTKEHFSEITRGHGDLPFQYLASALACRALGEPYWKRYKDKFYPKAIRYQQEDGSFRKGKKETPSATFYTAIFLLALQLSPGHLEMSMPGGTPADSTKATKAGLEYLASRQQEDGSWKPERAKGGFGSNMFYIHVTITSLACMALMSEGSTPAEGKYSEAISKGVDYIIKCARPDGTIVHQGDTFQANWETGYALLCLAEAYKKLPESSEKRKEIEKAVKKAVECLIKCQKDNGGWAYSPNATAFGGYDLFAATETVMIGLYAARDIGITVPQEVLKKAIGYIKSCQNSNGGFRYGVHPEKYEVTKTKAYQISQVQRSAGALYCLRLAGERGGEAFKKSVKYLEKHRSKLVPKILNPRYHHPWYSLYFTTIGMYQLGGKHWDGWYSEITKKLLEKQNEDGSWGKKAKGLTGGYAEKIFSTAVVCITFQMPLKNLSIIHKQEGK